MKKLKNKIQPNPLQRKDDWKACFLSLECDEKIELLSRTKQSEDLGGYLTLLSWLIESPSEKGGMDIQSIPDRAFWSV